ncbi:MAG TPA: DUF948 domain-containing protein [Bacilli bacterium]
MIIEISVALIAVSFAALVIYGIVTLKSVRTSLDQANDTLREIRQDAKDVIKESTRLMQNTNQIVANIQGKLHSADPIFRSIQDVSEAVHEVTSSVRQASTAVSQTLTHSVNEAVHRKENILVETIGVVSFAINRYLKWQASRNNKTGS